MQSAEGGLPAAILEWRQILKTQRILLGNRVAERYGPGTSRVARSIPAVLLPSSAADVAALVRVAQRHGVPLYPISTGHNWGWGDANPVIDDCVIVDLSDMNHIIAMDEELGLVTLEPGVTQGQLRQYLDDYNLPFMVPTTGAGPACSLIGNALEHGYGITPYTDHFLAVTALLAVLPNGELYQTPLSAMGAREADRAFKWGIGPYVDGLFAQGNFGIVIEMTIALARVPEQIEAFYFRVKRDEDLVQVVRAVRDTLRAVGTTIGGINVMNSLRWLAMTAPYPFDRALPGGALSPGSLAELSTQLHIPPWTGVGAIYGSEPVVAATRTVVQGFIEPHVERLDFIRPPIPDPKLALALDLMAGRPNEATLPLAYWKSLASQGGENRDPGRDGCGVLWYAPLVPMKPDRVASFTSMVRRICVRHGMEPIITFTSLSERTFDSTVPLLFNRSDSKEAARAEACFHELFAEGRKEGFLPYRTSVETMELMVDPSLPFWRFVSDLKRAVDPAGIIAPGRYCPLHSQP